MNSRTVVNRFWSNVRIMGPANCWEWTAGQTTSGYGVFWDGGMNHRAHRFIMDQWIKKIPPGRLVLHRCDNPLCVNPDHLYIGNHQDNMNDMVERGNHRLVYGEDNHNAKLTKEQVALIRKEYGMLTQALLAQRYNVSQGTISNIVTGKSWKHNSGVHGHGTG